MKKIFIWLLALGGGLVALLIAAVIFLPKFINVESYLPEIEQKVTEATGRSFNLGKDFNVSVFPWAGISFSDLQLGNPDEFGGGDFVKVKSFEVRVKIMPLLSKQIEINKFVLDGPEILLIKNEDGAGNWTMGDGSGEKTAAAPPDKKVEPPVQQPSDGSGLSLSSLEIGEFAITNGLITYVDKAADVTNTIDGITFRLLDVSLERPIDMMFKANVDGKPVSMEGAVGPIGQNPGQGTVNIDLAIQAFNELSVNVKGNITDPVAKQQFDMSLKVAQFSPRKLLNTLDMPFPVETTDPAVLNKVGLELNVSGDPANITLKDSSVVLDDSRLTLFAAVKEMAKPDITFKLELDSINIDRYLPPKKEKVAEPAAKSTAPSAEAAGESGPPAQQQAIDYEPLRKLVLDGEVKVGQLIAGGAKVENTEIKIVGKDGVFDLEPCRLDLYKGGMNVVGNFNFQQDKPAIKVDFKAEEIHVGPLLQDTVKKDILEGTMGAVTGISFVGDTPDEIKKSLNGKGDLRFLDGALVGIDLAEMGRNLKAGVGVAKPETKPRTDFAELGVPFTLTNGLFQTDATFLKSPLIRVNANGSADLVSEKLDMKVKPKIVGTLKGQGDEKSRSGLAIPILVGGTFSKPEYSADLSAIASEETIKEAIKDPDSAKKKAKELEESGKGLLQSFGFGKKKK